MKNKKRIMKSLIALFLVATIVITTYLNPITSEAADRFPGVQILVNKTTVSDPFTILEVVDNKANASFGFYIQGSEPFGIDANGNNISFANMLTSFNTTAERRAYVASLLTRLNGKYYNTETSPTGATAAQYPLVYSTYDETYFLNGADATDWTTVKLENKQTIQLNGTYVPTGVDANGEAIPGDYVKNENAYVVAPQGQGNYVENIAAFYSSEEPKNYNVVFKPIPENYTTSTAITESIAKYGVYVPISADVTDVFFYDGPAVGNASDVTYYYVESFTFVGTTENSGQYGIRYRDGEEKYIQVEAGQGTHIKNEGSYSLLEGLGSHNFVLDPNAPAVSVEVDRYYYKGGFTNNNWFKEKVLLLEAAELSVNAFPIVVKTVDLTELNENIFADADMVVISGSDPAKYRSINTAIWNALVGRITSAKLPCIINSELMNTTAQNSTFYQYMQGYYNASDADKNFVNGSLYWHTGDVFNVSLGTAFTEAQLLGFEQITEYLAEENAYRQLQNVAPLSRVFSQAVAIEHILGRQSARNISVKEKITVLELEPCADYFLTTKQKVRDILGYSSTDMPDNKIEIVQMTTAEFVGKIEDLNGKYDFIYIGMQTGKMNTDSSGNPVYNDSYMNGYVYTNIGDYVVTSERIVGMMTEDFPTYTDSNGKLVSGDYPLDESFYQVRTTMENGKLVMKPQTYTGFSVYKKGSNSPATNKTITVKNAGVFRYSGNDITEEKMNALKDYITAGYPIILDGKFRINDVDGKAIVNTGKVDNSSYLYELLCGNGKSGNEATTGIWGRNNLFFYEDIVSTSSNNAKKTEFQFYMSIPKLKIEWVSKPADAIGTTPQYIFPDGDGKYYLSYTFSVKDEAAALPASTLYTATLYVDMNTDGKFSRTTEFLDDAIIIDNGTGNQVQATQLLAGRNYTLKRQVPDGFKSAIPWKLEINQTGNTLIRQSDSGYSAIRRDATGGKKTINVLQIGSDKYAKWNLTTDDAFKKSVTNSLINRVTDFDINITHITASSYENTYSGEGYFNYLNQYDMLILGFADAYQDFKKEDSVNALIQYINTGKSVLFTHDTTSLTNYPADIVQSNKQTSLSSSTTEKIDVSDYRWGYLFNIWIRDLVGMDRYGITTTGTKDILKQGNVLNKRTDGTIGDFEKIVASGKDVAYVVGSGRTQTYPETQGYNYLTLNNSKDEKDTGGSTYYNLSHSKTNVGETGTYKNGALNNMKVTPVNQGQITKYPFDISEGFEVAQTHAQYYQLDLNADKDKDGETDICVWYCISDASGDKNMYNASPNDVRNNYYIYSIGNVFYSGVGHSEVTGEKEKMLFINTMVAAYSAQVTDPTVSTLIEEHVDAQEATTVRLPVEQSLEIESNKETIEDAYLDQAPVNFYYSVNDTNFVSSTVGSGNRKAMYVRYYLKSTDTNAVTIQGVEGNTLKGIDITDAITTTNTTSTVVNGVAKPQINTMQNVAGSGHVVQSGKAYTATINISEVQKYLGNKDSVSIYIVVSSTFERFGIETTQHGYDTIHIKKTNLFNLD